MGSVSRSSNAVSALPQRRGFAAGAVPATDIASLVTAFTDPWPAVVARPHAATRPEPSTWSPLEYACHVRDVCRFFEQRLALILEHDAPTFANWDQDETAVADRYNVQLVLTVDGRSGTGRARPGDRYVVGHLEVDVGEPAPSSSVGARPLPVSVSGDELRRPP